MGMKITQTVCVKKQKKLLINYTFEYGNAKIFGCALEDNTGFGSNSNNNSGRFFDRKLGAANVQKSGVNTEEVELVPYYARYEKREIPAFTAALYHGEFIVCRHYYL